MRKVCVVLTSRASYAKIRTILFGLKQREDVELQIVCAASAILERYGNVIKNVEKDGFVVSEKVYMVLEAENLLTTAKSAGFGLAELAGTFDRLKPDVVLVMADRYEVMSAAISAAYLNIPVAHVQGGEVSGNIDEKVRHAITKLADLHFPATQRAADWIIKMGENPDKVFLTGCPSIDLAAEAISNPEVDFDVIKKYGGVGANFDINNGYILVMQHPVTTEFGDARRQVNETLHAVTESPYNVMWFWPNPDAGSDETSKGIRAFRENYKPQNIHFFKNMEPLDFLKIAYNSQGIVGNSSAAIRECSYLGVPAINIGSRQLNRERGPNVVDVNYDRNQIADVIERHFGTKITQSHLYGKGNAGKKIADIVATTNLTFSKSLNYLDKSISE